MELTMVMEKMGVKPRGEFQVDEDRVVDVPLKKRQIDVGRGTKSEPVCFHRRVLKYPCALCEFEAPRLT